MTRQSILIAGVGNVFLGDDAFGVEVARRLAARTLPEGVRAVDFGIRGFDLACAVASGHDTVILVDTIKRQGTPGTLYLIEPACDEMVDDPTVGVASLEPHALDPVNVLRMANMFGRTLPKVYVVGCQPATFRFHEALELSAPVAAVLSDAVDMVLSLVDSLLDDRKEVVTACTS